MVRCVVLGIVCVLVGDAHADSDAKHATALFDEGQVLRKQGRLADACEKFEESYDLDPAIGTELNVADCRERQGKLDEAWELFDHAARTDKRADRAKYARARADSISKSLGKQQDDKPEKAEKAEKTEKDQVVDPPTDPELEEDTHHELDRSRPVERSPESAPAPTETEHAPIGWRIVFAGSLTVAIAGVGLIVYGHREITDAQQALCDGNGYPPATRLDVCTTQPTGTTLTMSQIDDLNAKGGRGHDLVIAGELAAVVGAGVAALGLYEGFIASHDQPRKHGVAIAPYVSPGGAGATFGLTW